MLNITSRNLRLYFRQKNMVFFSLLGVFIILGLYLLFLGDLWYSYLNNIVNPQALLSSWIIAGIVSVSTITTAMGAAGILVEDRDSRRLKDFTASPISRSKIIGGYLLSIFVVGLLMSLLTLLMGEVYIVSIGGSFLSLLSTIKVLGVLVLSVMASSSLVFFVVSFLSSTGAFTTASTLIGSLIGFLTGIYLPVGTLPQSIQMVIKLFPISHASLLLRHVLMEQPMQESFSGVPAQYLDHFRQLMGITYSYGDFTATPVHHALVLLGVSVLFYFLSLLVFTKKHAQ